MMRKKAQSFNEYAIVIALITLVVMGTQIYIKRGIQGVIKGSADILGSQEAGVIESGLYRLEDDQNPLTINIRKDIPITVSSGGGTRDLTNIRNDDTAVTGAWNATYKYYNIDTFNARDRREGNSLPQLPGANAGSAGKIN